ncbi:AMIN-like domain-containing (lipo)protein [Rhodococcus sp. (in: high G+C Gram-positive bacteria)]|uniref:AMIN-like domain-containing (lipo)protein n=1 Tax=Rhodococcus sp. TaxID=1831 RepID=UPI003B8A7CBF
MLSRIRSAAAFLSLGVLASGCAAGTGGEQPARTTAAAASCQQVESFAGTLRIGRPTPAPPTDAPPLRTLAPGEVPAGPTHPVLDAVTVGDGTDSVVFTFIGDGSIGWSARFVDIAFRAGTDARVPISGNCLLQIDLTQVDTGETWADSSPVHLSPSGASEVVEILSYPSTSQLAQAFIGTRSGAPVVTVDAVDPAGTLTVVVDSAVR